MTTLEFLLAVALSLYVAYNEYRRYEQEWRLRDAFELVASDVKDLNFGINETADELASLEEIVELAQPPVVYPTNVFDWAQLQNVSPVAQIHPDVLKAIGVDFNKPANDPDADTPVGA